MTQDVAWIEQPLPRHHDRASFGCGGSALNEYLQRYARQNHESGGTKTFVPVPLKLVLPLDAIAAVLKK